jgi:hypothetical protein
VAAARQRAAAYNLRMRSCLPAALALAVLALGPGQAAAEDAPPKTATAAPEPRQFPAEPLVQRTVIEDDNVRIVEVRVRGALRSTTVQPKGLITREYEVLPADGGRDLSPGPGGSMRAAAGQSVWRVLDF